MYDASRVYVRMEQPVGTTEWLKALICTLVIAHLVFHDAFVQRQFGVESIEVCRVGRDYRFLSEPKETE